MLTQTKHIVRIYLTAALQFSLMASIIVAMTASKTTSSSAIAVPGKGMAGERTPSSAIAAMGGGGPGRGRPMNNRGGDDDCCDGDDCCDDDDCCEEHHDDDCCEDDCCGDDHGHWEHGW
ncbi:hypothetical protein BGX29_000095 [Mortierella sp. GBA35]|nr:hypothetical protein BGX29_000095 [Mortierella sp. GBA35]